MVADTVNLGRFKSWYPHSLELIIMYLVDTVTYIIKICEMAFSYMKVVKAEYLATLSDDNLEWRLRI